VPVIWLSIFGPGRFCRNPEAIELNLDMSLNVIVNVTEFLKWGQQAFKTFGVVPPALASWSVNWSTGSRSAHASSPEGEIVTQTHWLNDSTPTIDQWAWHRRLGVGGIEAEAGSLASRSISYPEVVEFICRGAGYPIWPYAITPDAASREVVVKSLNSMEKALFIYAATGDHRKHGSGSME